MLPFPASRPQRQNHRSAPRGIAQAVSCLRWSALALGVCAFSGCKAIDEFDTGTHDAYCGQVVGAPFVREGFDRQLQLQIQLHLATLNTLPGEITTDDSDIGLCAPLPLFDAAKLRAPNKLESDALSTLSFGDSSLLNFMSWVDSTCQGTYLAVVSLLQDKSVEVRLLRGKLDPEGHEVGAFGIFKLKRAVGGCNFADGRR
jgi:hypothetical protein